MKLYPLTITPAELRATLLSHGWFDLEPLKVDIENLTLELAFKNQHGDGAFKVFVQNGETFCNILHGTETLVLPAVENCLSLDIDLTEIRSLINDVEGYNWFTERGFGRYLRSPTVYEDCIKIVSTVQKKFSSTKKIIQSLVQNYGCNVNGYKAFPEPNQLIRVSESSLKTSTNCGYRAKSFLDIADKSLENPGFFVGDAWKSLQPKDFFDRLLKIHGMGSASASYLCRIYGKPYNYAVDSLITKKCDELWGLNYRKTDKNGKEKTDLQKYKDYAKNRYESFREYGPHVFWFEISRHWHNKKKYEGAWWV